MRYFVHFRNNTNGKDMNLHLPLAIVQIPVQLYFYNESKYSINEEPVTEH